MYVIHWVDQNGGSHQIDVVSGFRAVRDWMVALEKQHAQRISVYVKHAKGEE